MLLLDLTMAPMASEDDLFVSLMLTVMGGALLVAVTLLIVLNAASSPPERPRAPKAADDAGDRPTLPPGAPV